MKSHAPQAIVSLIQTKWLAIQGNLLQTLCFSEGKTRWFLQGRGIELLIVLHPDELQMVEEGLHSQLRAMLNIPLEQFDLDKPQKRANAWARKTGMEIIDLLPVFRADADPGRLYLEKDTHYSAAGYELAAAAMLPILREKLIQSMSHLHALQE